MSNIAVVYKSRYGSTETYARWIAEETQGDLLTYDEASLDKLLEYDIIIYGGGLYAGGMLGFKRIKRHYNQLKSKKIVVFSVGASRSTKEVVEDVKNHNFTEEMKSNIELFHLRGALNYQKMNFFDRFLMFMLKKSIERKTVEDRDEDAKALLATYGKSVDFKNSKNIHPITEFIKRLSIS
ncbi:flavodoxin domain-containing protein [Clostridium polynesiense]|uniref:flavodoxin domain-containing protein n=1 Tax=Clostridium polynesiense TaxID=1325933 RepID=UPI00058DACAC|nr:flavodoxin domain-containing protein [Clostridium polynesiense]